MPHSLNTFLNNSFISKGKRGRVMDMIEELEWMHKARTYLNAYSVHGWEMREVEAILTECWKNLGMRKIIKVSQECAVTQGKRGCDLDVVDELEWVQKARTCLQNYDVDGWGMREVEVELAKCWEKLGLRKMIEICQECVMAKEHTGLSGRFSSRQGPGVNGRIGGTNHLSDEGTFDFRKSCLRYSVKDHRNLSVSFSPGCEVRYYLPQKLGLPFCRRGELLKTQASLRGETQNSMKENAIQRNTDSVDDSYLFGACEGQEQVNTDETNTQTITDVEEDLSEYMRVATKKAKLYKPKPNIIKVITSPFRAIRKAVIDLFKA